MQIEVLKSKIHRATVTDANLNYEGSISIDIELVKKANMHVWEKVDVLNVNNGARFSTYIIPGKKGEICLNGAAARMAAVGDKVIIVTYTHIEENDAENWQPKVILVDEHNEVKG
ncbi:MAG: aspartate 1-decarboxylase [Treponema sp.]|uniref:aspartate 1-decarboxylase n=1 Tax=Treponema sp. TaxID=166 RepID=UPI00298E0F6F|nr:aspartate 1-decarboxylase [Treponema sp.]MCR5385622.1 aspartate 1-decarboxylase [Treponema sp.]